MAAAPCLVSELCAARPCQTEQQHKWWEGTCQCFCQCQSMWDEMSAGCRHIDNGVSVVKPACPVKIHHKITDKWEAAVWVLTGWLPYNTWLQYFDVVLARPSLLSNHDLCRGSIVSLTSITKKQNYKLFTHLLTVNVSLFSQPPTTIILLIFPQSNFYGFLSPFTVGLQN